MTAIAAMGHPGSVLVPLLLSMAQLHRNDGKQMITAIVAAYDVYARLGEAINPFMYREKGFDATGVCGAVAAAALVSKLTNASAKQTKDAMGIASLFTGGLIEYQNDGTSGKILCSGWAALTGLRAVRLASCGFTGPEMQLWKENMDSFRLSKEQAGIVTQVMCWKDWELILK